MSLNGIYNCVSRVSISEFFSICFFRWLTSSICSSRMETHFCPLPHLMMSFTTKSYEFIRSLTTSIQWVSLINWFVVRLMKLCLLEVSQLSKNVIVQIPLHASDVRPINFHSDDAGLQRFKWRI